MIDAPIRLALVAGLLAAFNPCGFALLPAYLTLVIARPDSGRAIAAVGRALLMTLAMTIGFVMVFGAFGLVVVPAALQVQAALPWITVGIGLSLIVLGGWLAAGRELTFMLPRLASAAPSRSAWSMAWYGVAYGLASLSCTVAPFVALTAATFRTGGFASGLAAFAAYGVGMGLVVGALAVAVAVGREALVLRARRVLPYVSRASGVLLVLAGAYVTYYGGYELRVAAGADLNDPVIDAVLGVQGALARAAAALGPAWIAVALTAVVAAGFVIQRAGRRAMRRAGRQAAPPS